MLKVGGTSGKDASKVMLNFKPGLTVRELQMS